MQEPGPNAGFNTATDRIAVLREALSQLPGTRPGRRVLIRTDAAGTTHQLRDRIVPRRLSYSVSFTLPEHIPGGLEKVVEVTGPLDLSRWPACAASDRTRARS
jgi:hypothetical protein